jgi:multidrug efflux pump subunit AcrA (membrane-fusion protein)
MKKNLYLTYLPCLVLALLIQSCGGESSADEASDQKAETIGVIQRSKLQLMEVSSKNKQVEELISGRVIAKNETQLFSEVQGLILASSISIKPGISFRKGQTLLSIESEEFRLNLQSQKSAFLNMLTGIMPDLKSDYPDNYPEWLKYLDTIDINQSLAELPATKSKGEKFFVTSRGIYTSFYSLKALENRLSKYSIVAPYNGIITNATVDVGGLVSPGQPLATIISNELEIESGVSLKVAAQLKVGEKIDFSSNEMPGSWIGTLIRIGGTIDAQTQNIPVYFQISGQHIKPGMYLRGAYGSASFDDVYVIPSSALGRDQSVLILQGDLIMSKQVETIQIIQDSIVVKGLSAKDQVILTQFAEPVAGKKIVQ